MSGTNRKAEGFDGLLAPPLEVEPPIAKPLSVTQLTAQIKLFLETKFGEVLVEGEISGLRPAASGHIYFTLKDAGAAISGVIWARDAARIGKIPRDGDKVEIRGRISLFEQRGSYQIVVTSIRPAGLGRLFLAYQEMKERLEREGLFDSARKRAIPAYPKKIGIVTSPTGAAVRDILKVLSRRAPHIEIQIWPARVQGEGAGAEVAHGINRLNEMAQVDVLIVGRGGGSMEDLWAFNEEVVARAIFASAIPVISAVGHEIDFTIADFVADHRAPTPSAAAEIVAKNSDDLLRDLQQTTARLTKAMRQRYAFLREVPHLQARMEGTLFPRIELMKGLVRQFQRSHAVQRPLARVNEMRQQLDDFESRLSRGLTDRQSRLVQKHERLGAQLSALNPKSILGRGYSITFDAASGNILHSPAGTKPGQALRIVLGEGNLHANVGTPGVTPPGPTKRRTKSTRKAPAVPEWFGISDDSN